MRILTLLILLLVVIAAGVADVIKKHAMNQVGSISFTMETVLKVLTNPWALSVLIIGFGSWGLTLLIFSMEKASVAILLIHGALLIGVLLALMASHIVFGDVLTQTQYFGVSLVVVASIITCAGLYYVTA